MKKKYLRKEGWEVHHNGRKNQPDNYVIHKEKSILIVYSEKCFEMSKNRSIKMSKYDAELNFALGNLRTFKTVKVIAYHFDHLSKKRYSFEFMKRFQSFTDLPEHLNLRVQDFQ